MTSQYILQLALATYDAQGQKTTPPATTIYAPASFPYEQGATILPGASYTFFDGSRAIAADSTTAFTLSLSPLAMDPLYRFTWSGGTVPQLRISRAVDLSTHTITLTLNANQTLSVAASSGNFASAQVGDQVLVPGVLTGDTAGPFSEANVGFWVVLAKDGSSATLQLTRRSSESFSGLSESVTVASAAQFQVFAPGPVQVGDAVDVSAGFSVAVKRSYVVWEVSPTWFEVVVSDPLPILEVGVAGTPPTFYSNPKKVIWLQVDQEALVQVNGGSQRLAPVVPGQVSGQWLSTGPVWSLTVTNRSAQSMQAKVVGAS